MNNRNEIQQYFSFDVEIIFKVYAAVTRQWGMPTPELIINIYDDTVQNRLRELYYDLSPDRIENYVTHPWRDLGDLAEDKIKNLDELIGMRTLLEKRELLEVFEVYNMFYIDDFGMHCTMPIKGVW